MGRDAKSKPIILDHIDIYFVAFINIFLILGILVGSSNFFYSFYISLGLIMNTATLLTIFFTNPLLKKARIFKKYIVLSIGFETLLLFILSFLPLLNFILLEKLIIISIQSLSLIFFWKVYKTELVPLFDFLILTSRPILKNFFRKHSYLLRKVPKLKIPRLRNFPIQVINNFKRSNKYNLVSK